MGEHLLQDIRTDIQRGNYRSLARAISYVENGVADYSELLADLPASPARIIGVTGPPGAGKSTLVDALIEPLTADEKRVAVLCVDPSSTLYHGALLGDRIRMSDWYSHPRVFIRSLATRGALGGLHPRMLEIADLVRASGFDHIIVETVGVGQNEIEIAGLADTTIVVLAPEAGDDIQSMKAGLLEIADIFVVNKSDRPDADLFVRNLRSMQALSAHHAPAVVLKTIASRKEGIAELVSEIGRSLAAARSSAKKFRLLAEQAWLLIQHQKMRKIDKNELSRRIAEECKDGTFNLYRFVRGYV